MTDIMFSVKKKNVGQLDMSVVTVRQGSIS